MVKIDHHVHTTRYSPDSDITPKQLIAAAKAAKLDVVVITEHDHQWSEDELAELNQSSPNVLILSGAEVSAREGHFLVYGLPNLDDVPAGVTLRNLLKTVKAHDAAVVAAHPFRWGQDFDEIVSEHGAVFHGVEYVSNNVSPETRASTDRMLKRNPMPRTGSSDGHQPEIVGCYYSEVDAPVRTIADFVAALKAGKVRPQHNPGKPSAAGLLGGV